jgi:hypothetical protein
MEKNPDPGWKCKWCKNTKNIKKIQTRMNEAYSAPA